mmetsp:Transcript_22444/g.19381  ORF Transcript_22444/g.19381 Transcript_22444/m.19381 type:complete len:202 (-) Transcript_22444:436-1041(-)
MDPINMKILEMTSVTYFQNENEIVCIPSKGNMTEFMINEIEDSTKQKIDQSFMNTRYKPINLVVSRTEDWENFSVRTFLGDQLNEGDTVQGYDLSTLNLEGFVNNLGKIKHMPDIILLKKVYPDKKAKKRVWKLNHLKKDEIQPATKKQAELEGQDKDAEYEEFLREIEADKEMRSQINLFKDHKNMEEKQKAEEADAKET